MQTSIEWLQQKYDNCPESFLTEEDFEKAKEMHKHEIIKSNRDGVDMVIDKKRFVTGEQYYNETFKKDQL